MRDEAAKSGLIGSDEPLSAVERNSAPDKREVSFRWLAASVLTGVTSVTLMGTALFVALDGKQILATPPELASLNEIAASNIEGPTAKTARLSLPQSIAPPVETDRRRMSVSTMTRVGDVDVIRTKPFEHLRIALAADNRTETRYPPFDPLTIFAQGNDVELDPVNGSSIIYGANVESEASIRITDFDPTSSFADDTFILTDEEATDIVRQTAPLLIDGDIEVASLSYVDPLRFGTNDIGFSAVSLTGAARIVPQNISVAQSATGDVALGFSEEAKPIESATALGDALGVGSVSGADGMANALATLLNTDSLKRGQTLRIGYQHAEGKKHIVRASIYDASEHIITIALNDEDQYVPTQEPIDPGVMADQNEAEPVVEQIKLLAERDLPNTYDAIYRGILAHGLNEEQASHIIRLVSADVDFRSRIRLSDELDLFYSVPEEGENESAVELLYVGTQFGDQKRQFYRFTDSEGGTDYFDSEGRSARQFLLRNPVPNGRFTSGFGMRIHPIHRFRKMHWGVDWAAPRGTPIIAPGNGVVEKTGWAGGYGRQLVIRHANGYETMYAHLASFARGIQPGARVTQGQVIARVGNTGLSTGPHLHYELSINGERVDPMRVRLPQGKTLVGADLEAFKKERDRINALLEQRDAPTQQLASAG